MCSVDTKCVYEMKGPLGCACLGEGGVVWCYVSTDTLPTKQNVLSYQTAGRPGCRHCSLYMFIEFAV